MKSRTWFSLAITFSIPLLPLPGLSQNQEATKVPASYDVINLGTPLGGFFAIAVGVNTEGVISGYGNLPSNETQHALLWLGGHTKDLGTLGGPNSAILGNFSGFSELSTPDPLGQDFCED
ncbi:MAG TPA: hypothetical protein VHX11_04945, partial [Acidobacteriaceae bacterium]|nr:hypothetical protein [Acidobacteriaceae bacterium]